MCDAIGGMLSSAIGVASSPLPLIALILMLATPRGRATGIDGAVLPRPGKHSPSAG